MKRIILASFLFVFALSAQAQVSTMYGNGASGYGPGDATADSVNTEFTTPYGCAFDTKGNLWITDQGNNYVVMINAGKYQMREGDQPGGFHDGSSVGQFGGVTFAPAGIIVVPGKTSANDQIYLCDAGNNAIRKIDSFTTIGNAQYMHTVAGGGVKNGGLGQSGFTNGSGASALFNDPVGLAYVNDGSGGYLLVADQGNSAIRKVSLHKSDYGTTSTVTTSINGPSGIFVDKSNNIYVSSLGSGISKLTPSGTVTNIALSNNFEGPTDLVVRGTDMFIADNCHIAWLDMTQPVDTANPKILTGDPTDTLCNFKDGSYQSSLFNGIGSMALSPDSTYLVVADGNNNRIRKVILPKAHVHTSGLMQNYVAKDRFDIYPNPSHGHVIIRNRISDNADITILSTTGRILMHKNISLQSEVPYEMNLGNLPGGLYIMQISTNKGVYNNKLIVK